MHPGPAAKPHRGGRPRAPFPRVTLFSQASRGYSHRMPAAARVAPKDYFSPDEWAPLARRSAWKGPALIAHAWLVILAAAAMAMAFPVTIPLAVPCTSVTSNSKQTGVRHRWNSHCASPLIDTWYQLYAPLSSLSSSTSQVYEAMYLFYR